MFGHLDLWCIGGLSIWNLRIILPFLYLTAAKQQDSWFLPFHLSPSPRNQTCHAGPRSITIWDTTNCVGKGMMGIFAWLVGLGVWFSLWVREVPGSNPGRALQPVWKSGGMFAKVSTCDELKEKPFRNVTFKHSLFYFSPEKPDNSLFPPFHLSPSQTDGTCHGVPRLITI